MRNVSLWSYVAEFFLGSFYRAVPVHSTSDITKNQFNAKGGAKGTKEHSNWQVKQTRRARACSPALKTMRSVRNGLTRDGP